MRKMILCAMMMLLCASLTMSCKKSETCENYVEKSASCSKKKLDAVKVAKMKAFVVAICLAEKGDKDLAPFAKQRIACIHKKTCEEFHACTKEVRKASRKVRRRIRLRKQMKKIAKYAADGNFYKAQRSCSYGFSAKRMMKSDNKEDQAAAKAYYDYCLKNLPVWLGKLRDAGTKKSFFGIFFNFQRYYLDISRNNTYPSTT